MTTSRIEEKDKIVLSTLPHVPFDGWERKALRAGAADAGFPEERADQLFPGGALDAVVHFCDLADRMMLDDLSELDFDSLRVREKIATAVRTRLERWYPCRDAVRRAVGIMMRPQAAGASAKTLYNTVHAMWRAAGDRSTDYNFYTKRGLLAGVYSSTLLVWLDDKSAGCKATWAFLDRRIENVMMIEKAKARLKSAVKDGPDLKRFGDLVRPRWPRSRA